MLSPTYSQMVQKEEYERKIERERENNKTNGGECKQWRPEECKQLEKDYMEIPSVLFLRLFCRFQGNLK